MSKERTSSHTDKSWGGGGFDKVCNDKVCVSNSWDSKGGAQEESKGSGGSYGGSPDGSGHIGGGYSSGGSKFVETSNSYGLHNLKELPRIANDTEFAATCHGSIAVNSIIDHAITRNAEGYGADALASLQTINLSHNGLHNEHVMILNDGLYGYTMNVQTFNLSYNNT